MDLKSSYPHWAVKNGLMYAFPQLDAGPGSASPYTLEIWKRRTLREKLVERLLWPIRSQLLVGKRARDS